MGCMKGPDVEGPGGRGGHFLEEQLISGRDAGKPHLYGGRTYYA